jgi:hypothetical protein
MRVIPVLFLALTVLDCKSTGTCEGQCAAGEPIFDHMVLLWSGPAGTTPPACPEVAPSAKSGYVDTPPTTVECDPPCTCTPTQGACSSVEWMYAQLGDCFSETAPMIPFAPPPMWDGTCTDSDPVASATNVTMDSPHPIPQMGCLPSELHAAKIDGGETIARVCSAAAPFPPGKCPSANEQCAYPSVDGFQVCLAGDRELNCPPGWPEKHTFFDDARECACSCGDPAGESCSVTVTIYKDSACMNALGSDMYQSPEVTCLVFPPSMIGSKSATPPVYLPGACPPTLTKSLPTTLCCLP